MKRLLREKVKEVVDSRVDDYEEMLMDMYGEVGVEEDEYGDIEVNNLLVELIIKKFSGLRIISG